MRFWLLNVFVLIFSLVNAQNHNLPKDLSQKTLLTIQNKPISADDFWYVFTKNLNDEHAINQEELKEYFTLFQNFKLKVEAAKDAGLDKTPEFEKEFELNPKIRDCFGRISLAMPTQKSIKKLNNLRLGPLNY